MMNSKTLFRDFVKGIELLESRDEIQSMAYLVFENILGLTKTAILAEESVDLSETIRNRLEEIVARINRFEPVQYILGESFFYGRSFGVNPAVLIPRPETEELVRLVINFVRKTNKKNCRILDIGTGSGCIAIALKNKLRVAEVWACDISDQALNIARINADALHATIDFVPLNFLDPEQRKQLPNVDVIVSNPPYVPQNEKAEMKKNVAEHEPLTSLFVPGDDPLIFYKAIAEFGMEKLSKGGSIYVEIHENLGELVKNLFLSKGYRSVELRKDMQGKDRMVKVIN